ncbi:hypothetical protein GJ496_008067 [Pomphorhynchus laevis]|nr:hypothetical protein GJ496_008067 [Pomphorhynchus laevis]
MRHGSIKVDCIPHQFNGFDSIIIKKDGGRPLTAFDTITIRKQDYIDGLYSNMQIKWNQFSKLKIKKENRAIKKCVI